MNILEQIAAKAEKGDTGMSLHYGFLYSCVVGLETQRVFEFGSGFSTHVILHALAKTGGNLKSCDITHYNDNPNVTEFTKNNDQWQFNYGNSNVTFNQIEHEQYDLILHDGSHVEEEVLLDLENCQSYLKHDGILDTHDTRHHDLGHGLRNAVESFAMGKELEMCTLPYGYGLTFFRNKDAKQEKVNLTWRKR